MEGFVCGLTFLFLCSFHDIIGALEREKLADLVVLDSEIYKISKYDILSKAKVAKTIRV